MRGNPSPLPADGAISELAARQHGVISRPQLQGLGLGRHAIDRRIAAKRLHPIHRGVYAVGHPRISREGHWLAAVLACGPDAVLSHRSAAALHGIRQYSGRIELTVPTPRRRGSRQFVARRSSLAPDEITDEPGIPTTTVARTLIDLAAVLTETQLDKAIQRHPRRKGTAALTQALRMASQLTGHTRSELEDHFRTLLLRADLPRPVLNATIELGDKTIEVDAKWGSDLIVELDGHAAHRTKRAFEADRLRDRRLAAAGYTVIRVTWRQLLDEPDAVLDDISACMRPRSGRLPAGAPRA